MSRLGTNRSQFGRRRDLPKLTLPPLSATPHPLLCFTQTDHPSSVSHCCRFCRCFMCRVRWQTWLSLAVDQAVLEERQARALTRDIRGTFVWRHEEQTESSVVPKAADVKRPLMLRQQRKQRRKTTATTCVVSCNGASASRFRRPRIFGCTPIPGDSSEPTRFV